MSKSFHFTVNENGWHTIRSISSAQADLQSLSLLRRRVYRTQTIRLFFPCLQESPFYAPPGDANFAAVLHRATHATDNSRFSTIVKHRVQGVIRRITPGDAVPKSVFTETYRRFVRMLIEARMSAGVTQTELAKLIGWQQTDVSKVERGERRLDIVEFLQFAEALKLDAPEFVRRLQGGRKR